jgi:hypothetical protein
MFGNIWLSSALIVTAIFSAGAMYKSYSDIQEAKQIQEHYTIISEIKTLLAIQYNKNPQDITRDEIILHLPSGGNWKKVLLLDRNTDSTWTNKELINEDGKMDISPDEKLKLLALKAKLKDITNVSAITPVDGKYTFEVGLDNKNEPIKEIEIQKALNRATSYMINKVVYDGVTTYSDLITTVLNNFTPLNDIYVEKGTLSDDEVTAKKKDYFKSRLKTKLSENQNSEETRLYHLIKDVL